MTLFKRIMCIVCTLLICLSFAACSGETQQEKTLVFPDSVDVGGYAIKTNNMLCRILVNGEYKYTYFESIAADRYVELYITPTEMYVSDHIGDDSKFHYEEYEDIDQVYENPVNRLFDDLRDLSFVYEGEQDKFGGVYDVYETVVQKYVKSEQQINCVVYTIELLWKDSKTYEFKYYVYEDGSTFVGAEAPDIINPEIYKATNWKFDIENSTLDNSDTGESIQFKINKIENDRSLSPSGNNSTLELVVRTFKVYTDVETGRIEYLQFSEDDNATAIKILYEFDVDDPYTLNSATEMSSEEYENTMMLLYMLETLI